MYETTRKREGVELSRTREHWLGPSVVDIDMTEENNGVSSLSFPCTSISFHDGPLNTLNQQREDKTLASTARNIFQTSTLKLTLYNLPVGGSSCFPCEKHTCRLFIPLKEWSFQRTLFLRVRSLITSTYIPFCGFLEATSSRRFNHCALYNICLQAQQVDKSAL